MTSHDDNPLARRDFLKLGVGAAAVVPSEALAREPLDAVTDRAGSGVMSITLHVNGRDRALSIDPRTTLLDALREHIGLTGTKKGCDHGQCGACTLHVDGERVLSCLSLAAQADGRQITTIEGLAEGDTLHAVQQAFIDHDAFQCGYCTSGQIMSGVACIREGHARTDDEIREYMSGNLCRCAAYPNIVDAIRQAANA